MLRYICRPIFFLLLDVTRTFLVDPKKGWSLSVAERNISLSHGVLMYRSDRRITRRDITRNSSHEQDVTARRQMEQEMLQTTAKLSNMLRIQTR